MRRMKTTIQMATEEWNAPEMDIYDNYDAAKANL